MYNNMDDIALVLLSVWLCFYQSYNIKNWLDEDVTASIISLLAALKIIFF